MTSQEQPRPARRRPVRRGALPAAPSLLLAEADDTIAEEVATGLAKQGIEVLRCRDGAEALLMAGLHQPSLVLLGAPLPMVDAASTTDVITRLSPTPVIIGIGPTHAEEAVAALSSGARALVARPYRLTEILPLLQPAGDASGAGVMQVGDIELDPAGLHAYVRGELVPLPLREFQLLRYLMQYPNRVMSRQQILRELWGSEVTDTNTLTVHIKRLRAKLSAVEGGCCTIDTVRGLGYRLECPEAAQPRSRSASR